MLLYFGGGGTCDYVVEINNNIFEPDNLNSFKQFILLADTQFVEIDYELMNTFSTCGIDRIQIFCLNPK